MPEYTYADVIIDPEDPRVEIGKEYYFGDNPTSLLYGVQHNWPIRKLEDVSNQAPSISPFYNGSSFFACVIRKKEPEKKYVPFDLSDPEARKSLRGKWLIGNQGREEMITAFHTLEDGKWTADMSSFANATGDGLLRFYTFDDGTPCGRLVEEKR